MKVKFIILIVFSLTWGSAFAGDACPKCNLQKIKSVGDSLGKLTIALVTDFLCTFDSSCINNAEFSEMSNAMLFKVINRSPELFFQAIAQAQIKSKVILNEIQNPVNDLIDLQKTYDSLKAVSAPVDLKAQVLNALVAAGKKGGLEIKK